MFVFVTVGVTEAVVDGVGVIDAVGVTDDVGVTVCVGVLDGVTVTV